MQKKISLCILSAILLAAPFLSPIFFPLAWVAFVPLFWIIRQAENLRRAVLFGWLAGVFAHVFGFHWLVYTISVFGGFSYLISTVVFVLYTALQGIHFALFAWFINRVGLGPLGILSALVWVALEFWFPSLFPWYLANSQSSFNLFIQTADLVGPYGVSLLIMWFNTALYALVFEIKREQTTRWMPMAYVLLFVVASLVYGHLRLGAVGRDMGAARKMEAAAVQGNIDVDLKWNPTQVRQNLEKYLNLTQQVKDIPIVIWPESTIEVWLPDELEALPPEMMPQLIADRAYFIFGARSFAGQLGSPNFRAFNTAFLADGKGRLLGRYHKQVLLAFGEYLPFAKILSKLPALPFSDGFTAGAGPAVFHLSRGIRIAPLICYEDLMPFIARDFVTQTKANVLVNLTNDAWYGKTVAPWQHARLSQWRAIETRRSLLRVTNTGVTGLVNAKGEMVESLPIFTEGVLKTQIDVLEGETLYVRFGDWFAWSATVISIGVIAILWRRSKRLA